MKKLVQTLLLLLAAAILCGAMPAQAEAGRTQYRAAMVQLDDATYQLHCEVEYTNRTGKPLTGVLFTVYANQLRRESSLVAENDLLEATFPNGYAPGGVEFGKITVNGEKADWGMQGDKELFIRVGCDLQPGESAVFAFDYQLLLIFGKGELGLSEKDIRLSGFLPGVAVFDDDEFVVNDTSAIDRYALHEPADYVIDMTIGSEYTPAASGTCISGEQAEGYRAWRIEAKGVREMALSLSTEYREQTVTSNMGTNICLLGWEKSGIKRAAETAKKAIDLLEMWFGKAPYDQISIVQADMVNNGSVYGGMAWIPAENYAGKNKVALEHDVVYRLAQQYFGMGAGNDPVQAPWLSVSVPEMAYYMYIDALEGRDNMLGQLNEDCLAALIMTLPGGYTVDSSLNAFTGHDDFEIVVRHRGAAAMYQIREAMGGENFAAGLRLFYERHNGDIAGLQEFVGAFNDACGREYDLLIVDWMYTIDDYQGVIIDWFE